MKRMFSFFLALALLAVLSCCGKREPTPSRPDEPTPPPEEGITLAELNVEFVAGDRDTDALMQLKKELPPLLIGALADEGVTVGRVNVTFGASDEATADALARGARRIVEFAEQFQRGMTGIERFAEIMDTPVAIKDAPDAVPLQPGPGEIRFEKVCFEYPDDHNKVLHDVSLDIRAGERLALVGASGGGKTTLCNLIPRFYEVTSGRILIDGQDIRRVTLKSLRQDIGIVQQDVYLFSGTVAQNIAYGKPGATRQEIEAAARLAGAEKFILALKDGYDTYVGERGVKLSGGQKQRIAIARVFLKNPPILILDEATSALDNESEILVGQSLEKLAHGRTTLTIAHRLTTIKDYDRILVLGEEGIVEEGTHAQLLEKQGVYYRLWNQLPAEDEE